MIWGLFSIQLNFLKFSTMLNKKQLRFLELSYGKIKSKELFMRKPQKHKNKFHFGKTLPKCPIKFRLWIYLIRKSFQSVISALWNIPFISYNSICFIHIFCSINQNWYFSRISELNFYRRSHGKEICNKLALNEEAISRSGRIFSDFSRTIEIIIYVVALRQRGVFSSWKVIMQNILGGNLIIC